MANMPELPEVETIRRGLHRLVVGRRLVGFDLIRPDMLCGNSRELNRALVGKHITDTGRQGKALWLCLEGHVALGVHLGMSGQLRLVSGDSELPKHTHLTLKLAGGNRLIYVDPRRFGRLELLDTRRLQESSLLCKLGPDAISGDLSAEQLLEAAASHGIALKQFLLDQTHLAGLGNIYVCEILHRCGLHPQTPANRVTGEEMCGLLEATRVVLADAIEAGGTTLADTQYQTVNGDSGGYQHRVLVYSREGEPCLRSGCSGVIERYTSAGRSTYLCPVCQARGRRRRSR